MNHRRTLAAVAILAAVGFAACGEADSDPTPVPAAAQPDAARAEATRAERRCTVVPPSQPPRQAGPTEHRAIEARGTLARGRPALRRPMPRESPSPSSTSTAPGRGHQAIALDGSAAAGPRCRPPPAERPGRRPRSPALAIWCELPQILKCVRVQNRRTTMRSAAAGATAPADPAETACSRRPPRQHYPPDQGDSGGRAAWQQRSRCSTR